MPIITLHDAIHYDTSTKRLLAYLIFYNTNESLVIVDNIVYLYHDLHCI